MTINNPRREFEERTYIEAAFFLQISAKKLRTLYLVPVTHIEYSKLPMANSFNTEDVYITLLNDKIYYKENPQPLTLLCSAYLLSIKNTIQISPMLNKLHNWTLRNTLINKIYTKYNSNLQRELNEHINTVPYFVSANLSIKQINKIMAKHKGFGEIVDGHLKLTFNKIKCGNEIEGYVNYKSITVFLPLSGLGTRNLNSSRIIYTFQKFSIDTNDSIDGLETLHPHISGHNSFCFGNRDNDWDLYSETCNFPFLIDLIYESLNSFNPGSPYIHVSTIVNIVKVLNVVYKDYRKLNPASTPQDLASHIFAGVNRCHECDTILGLDGKCFGERCKANPNAEIACHSCGVHKKRGEWLPEEHFYDWICENPSCPRSPNYRRAIASNATATISVAPIRPTTPPILRCRVCGEDLLIDDDNVRLAPTSFNPPFPAIADDEYRCWSCENENHSYIRDIWQYVENIQTGEIISLEGHHYERSFMREIESQNH